MKLRPVQGRAPYLGCQKKGATPLAENPFLGDEVFPDPDAAAAGVLMAAAGVALLVANSPLAPLHGEVFAHVILGKTLLHWINDGLMTIFFFVVGLEIKREVVAGELSTRSKAALPFLAAAGGMIGPALIYVLLNEGDDLRGWAIPTATDIAFALGILALLGSRVPPALKVFLTALAVIDDVGAILIIALFYTAELSNAALAGAGVSIALLIGLNRMRVRAVAAYVVVGIILWACVLNSGVHATMAGVITAFAVPAGGDAHGKSPLLTLEHALKPAVTFFILPLFAFANAGVGITDLTAEVLLHPVTVGIAAGLFFGKQVGVLAVTYLARAAGWVQLPVGASAAQYYGTALLCGVGFTMSLFIGNLAFDENAVRLLEVKAGVLAGSLVSGIAGYIIIWAATRPK